MRGWTPEELRQDLETQSIAEMAKRRHLSEYQLVRLCQTFEVDSPRIQAWHKAAEHLLVLQTRDAVFWRDVTSLGVLAGRRGTYLDVRGSPKAFGRMLKLFDRLIRAVERRGASVANVDRIGGWTEIVTERGEVPISIREYTREANSLPRRYVRPVSERRLLLPGEPGLDCYWAKRRREWIATERLSIHSGSRIWSDDRREGPLEWRVDSIADELVAMAAATGFRPRGPLHPPTRMDLLVRTRIALTWGSEGDGIWSTKRAGTFDVSVSGPFIERALGILDGVTEEAVRRRVWFEVPPKATHLHLVSDSGVHEFRIEEPLRMLPRRRFAAPEFVPTGQLVVQCGETRWVDTPDLVLESATQEMIDRLVSRWAG